MTGGARDSDDGSARPQPLGRVVDRDAVARAGGPRGSTSIAIPRTWLADGAELEIVLPSRVVCARCEGGGCDACDRSGALRLPRDAGERTLRLRVEPSARDVAVRVDQPFGPGGSVTQLTIAVRGGDDASEGVRRVEATGIERRDQPRGIAVGVCIVVALALLIALLVARAG